MKSPADVESFEKTLDFGKIVRIAIFVAHGDRKMKNIMHHARLKNIFEKLIIVNRPTRLDLKNPTLDGGMGVSVETLQYLASPSKEDRNNYLVLDGLPLLDSKSDPFQSWAEPCHNAVARLIGLCARVDGISHFLEERNDSEPEFGRR